MFKRFRKNASRSTGSNANTNGIILQGQAMRVIFYYPGEEGTYIDNSQVTVFANGIVHVENPRETCTTHLENCEILWRFDQQAEERGGKLRLINPAARPPEPSPSE